MGAGYSRKPGAIEETYRRNPKVVANWDIKHVRSMLRWFKEGNYDFGLDFLAFQGLLGSSLPESLSLASQLWRDFVTDEGVEMMYSLELFAALGLLCQGKSR